MSFDTLESLCSRFDPSVSLKEAFIKRADEFSQFVHGKDRNNDSIDFSNTNSILARELYKEQLFDKAQRKLNISSWQRSWAGTGKIYNKLLPLLDDKDNNLIKYYGITHLKNHITDNNGNYYIKAEQTIYDIFRGENESLAFSEAIEEFGGRYPTIAYLFFLKDDKRFLPCAPRRFEESFQQLNIDINLAGECSWENYCTFIRIIDCIRELMPDYMQLEHAPTLLEAHSFVWIIGREDYINWHKAQEYQRLMALEKQRIQQEKEERERNRIPTKHLSDFSEEELISLAPSLVNKVIHNTIHGEATIIEFVTEPELMMTIVNTDDEDSKYSEPTGIRITNASKKNYYFTLEELSKISSGEDNTKVPFKRPLPELGTIEISEDENEQIEQAARMSIEQLRSVAASRESIAPEKHMVPTQQYKRDNFIAELSKRQAKGICQLCGNPAPFITSEGKPYLESHHIVWLSEGGADTIENTAAVCPNCHRRLHYLNDENDVKKLITNKQVSMQQ